MGRRPLNWPAPLAIAAAVALAAAGLAPVLAESASSGEVLHLNSELRIRVRLGRVVELETLARPGTDYEDLASRFCGTGEQAPAIAAANEGRAPADGQFLRVPLGLLSPEMRSLVLRTLFPEDGHDGGDWIHVARRGRLPLYDEGLWQVASWFTRQGGAGFEALLQANQLDSPELVAGQRVRIPAELLHPAFELRARSDDGSLEYGVGADGPYASYRLRAGEALYSAVVGRFTGRTGADDVRALADELALRNRIRDLRDIPVGFEIHIPIDLLVPEYLPPEHPRRQEAERLRAALERELEKEPVAGTEGGLDGVIVILDPGHGGRDLGTHQNGIWEHDYVYDVACRLKQRIEKDTRARVVLTLLDLETGCEPSAGDTLVANRQGSVLTTPPFLADGEGDSSIGVNLRWYLANSILRDAEATGTDPRRVVFVSLHADSRHASLRGVMVYVPGASYRARTYGSSSGIYGRFEEVREKPHVHFSKKERLRSEAVSRKLADAVVRAFDQLDLPVQKHQPVRDKVIRGKESWVPAVLRGNEVPAKVLVELLNLSNPEDASLLGSAAARDRLAEGVLLALYDFFGEKRPSGRAPSSVAAR